MRSAWTRHEAARLRRNDRHRIGVLHCVRAAAHGYLVFEQGEHQPCSARDQRRERREAVFAWHFRVWHLTAERPSIEAMTCDRDWLVGLAHVHFRVDAVTRGTREDFQRLIQALP